ncbi:MAG: SIMPL domain-containing protein [Planctomycetota bacterium]
MGVVTEDPEPTEALNRNSRQMQNVTAALEKAGLDRPEYETGRFSVQPVFERRPRNAGADWRARIIGYQVTNSLAVRTKKLELAGKLIEAANDAGANSIDSISFDLANPRTHRGEATTNARSDAGILARSAELKLVRIISISLDEAGWRPPVAAMRAGVAMAEAKIAPPIAPGKVTVRASVTIVYEVEPVEK